MFRPAADKREIGLYRDPVMQKFGDHIAERPAGPSPLGEAFVTRRGRATIHVVRAEGFVPADEAAAAEAGENVLAAAALQGRLAGAGRNWQKVLDRGPLADGRAGAFVLTPTVIGSAADWIDRDVEVDAATLKAVALGVLEALAVANDAGRPQGQWHGRLTPDRVLFLTGHPVAPDEVQVCDPDPRPTPVPPPAMAAGLAGVVVTQRRADTGTPAPDDDLSHLGRILTALVTGQPFDGATPGRLKASVATAAAWAQLGRGGEAWADWCGELMRPGRVFGTPDPRVLADTVRRLPGEARVLRGVDAPGRSGRPLLAVAGVGAALLLAGAAVIAFDPGGVVSPYLDGIVPGVGALAQRDGDRVVDPLAVGGSKQTPATAPAVVDTPPLVRLGVRSRDEDAPPPRPLRDKTNVPPPPVVAPEIKPPVESPAEPPSTAPAVPERVAARDVEDVPPLVLPPSPVPPPPATTTPAETVERPDVSAMTPPPPVPPVVVPPPPPVAPPAPPAPPEPTLTEAQRQANDALGRARQLAAEGKAEEARRAIWTLGAYAPDAWQAAVRVEPNQAASAGPADSPIRLQRRPSSGDANRRWWLPQYRLALDFVRVEPADGPAAYVAAGELSIGDAASLLAALPSNAPLAAPLRAALAASAAAPEPRLRDWTLAGDRLSPVSSGAGLDVRRRVSGAGLPGADSPVQALSPEAARLLARAAGCRLMTAGEWRAALDQVRAAPNLGEQAKSFKLRGPLFQSNRDALAGVATYATLADATDDGTAWTAQEAAEFGGTVAAAGNNPWQRNLGPLFRAVAARDEPRAIDLVGNVAEYVLAGDDAATDPDGATAVGVIGGSTLSPPSLPPDRLVPLPATGAAGGFADVGVRLAFTDPEALQRTLTRRDAARLSAALDALEPIRPAPPAAPEGDTP